MTCARKHDLGGRGSGLEVRLTSVGVKTTRVPFVPPGAASTHAPVGQLEALGRVARHVLAVAAQRADRRLVNVRERREIPCLEEERVLGHLGGRDERVEARQVRVLGVDHHLRLHARA